MSGARRAQPRPVLSGALVCAAIGLGQVAAAGAGDADSPSAAVNLDARALIRAAQLQSWLDGPVPLAQALCMQQRLAARWPGAPQQALDERDRDRLRLAQEHCATAVAADDDTTDLRLVGAARATLQQQLTRLLGLQARIRDCRDRAGAGDAPPAAAGRPALAACVAQLLGRPVGEAELRELVAAASR